MINNKTALDKLNSCSIPENEISNPCVFLCIWYGDQVHFFQEAYGGKMTTSVALDINKKSSLLCMDFYHINEQENVTERKKYDLVNETSIYISCGVFSRGITTINSPSVMHSINNDSRMDIENSIVYLDTLDNRIESNNFSGIRMHFMITISRLNGVLLFHTNVLDMGIDSREKGDRILLSHKESPMTTEHIINIKLSPWWKRDND